jgi:hypothetical protein
LVKSSNFSWVFIVGENELVGQSAAMRDVRRLIDIAAPPKQPFSFLAQRAPAKNLSPAAFTNFQQEKAI